MKSGYIIPLIALVVGILLIASQVGKINAEKRINPSDVICSTFMHCEVGNVTTYNVGDAVSSPKYWFGFKIGIIQSINPENKTAVIGWKDSTVTTEFFTDLNKLKKL
jgi:hypothetical protein